MTYNFDPDRWYDIQRAALEARRAKGELGEEDYQAELDRLERRYEEMTSRLDKPFDLSDTPRSPAPPRREQ
jgi:hypothetical protein